MEFHGCNSMRWLYCDNQISLPQVCLWWTSGLVTWEKEGRSWLVRCWWRWAPSCLHWPMKWCWSSVCREDCWVNKSMLKWFYIHIDVNVHLCSMHSLQVSRIMLVALFLFVFSAGLNEPRWTYNYSMQCFCITIPPALRPTRLRQMDIGSLTWAQSYLGACRTQRRWGEGGVSGAKKSAQELTRRDRKTVPHTSSGRDSNPGSSDWKSDALPLSCPILNGGMRVE